MNGENKTLMLDDSGDRQECYMPVAADSGIERPPLRALFRKDLDRARTFDATKRHRLSLCRPSVLLLNFDAMDSLRLEIALHLCASQIGTECIDVLNLGSSNAGLREMTGSVAAVVLLKIPDPKHDSRGFSWARKTLNQLVENRMLTVVPVFRDREQAPVFLRAISSACPYYMSSQSDFFDQCRMLTVLIEGLCCGVAGYLESPRL